jgi:hypothetical protein
MVMRTFDERRQGFEAEFKRDQELVFRIAARRNRLLGLWAAEKLGLPAGDPAESYAKTVVAADFEAPGDSDVVAKVLGDLAAKGVAATEAEVRAELKRAAEEARRQLAGR